MTTFLFEGWSSFRPIAAVREQPVSGWLMDMRIPRAERAAPRFSEDAKHMIHGRRQVPPDWMFINQDALNSVDLDGLVRNVDRFDCHTFSSEVARVEREEGRWSPEQRECLNFINAALMMRLRPDEPADPYGPKWVMDGRRSAVPSDFDKQGLRGIEPWALSLKDPELRARFLDVLWVQARSFPAAKGAVEAYIASAIRMEHPREWSSTQKRLERALRLAAGLGKGGAELRKRVLEEIEAMLHRHRGTDLLYLTMRLIRLLLEFKHGDAAQFAYSGLNLPSSPVQTRQPFRFKAANHSVLAEATHSDPIKASDSSSKPPLR
ncbi:MAG: hypothetical protein WAP57_13645 [Aquabacterium commune]|uniref:DUF7380 domain-containing protein n=1 Tax=Aquabacterium commune TaxID=70586 RepID=UPI003BB1EDBD